MKKKVIVISIVTGILAGIIAWIKKGEERCGNEIM